MSTTTHPGYHLCTTGHPALRQRAHEVKDPTAAKWRDVAAGMTTTMLAAGGVGIAAPQVGMLSRLFVTAGHLGMRERDFQLRAMPEVLVNPTVLHADGAILSREGCLSLPGEQHVVRRARVITVEFTDLNGELRQVTAREFEATVLQHELDHLDGVLIDRRAVELVRETRALADVSASSMTSTSPDVSPEPCPEAQLGTDGPSRTT